MPHAARSIRALARGQVAWLQPREILTPALIALTLGAALAVAKDFMESRALPVILFSVLCSSTAHLFLKKGAAALFGGVDGSTGGLLGLAEQALTNGWLWAGLVLHGVALLTWVYALGKAELSFAYPFIALGFVLTAIFAAVFMQEVLSPTRLAGMGLITVGLVFVARG